VRAGVENFLELRMTLSSWRYCRVAHAACHWWWIDVFSPIVCNIISTVDYGLWIIPLPVPPRRRYVDVADSQTGVIILYYYNTYRNVKRTEPTATTTCSYLQDLHNTLYTCYIHSTVINIYIYYYMVSHDLSFIKKKNLKNDVR